MPSSSPPPAPRSAGPARARSSTSTRSSSPRSPSARSSSARASTDDRHRRHRPRRVAPGRRRHRPLHRRRASGSTHVPGVADNRHCAAGLSAVQIAAGGHPAGMDTVVVAGGTESLEHVAAVVQARRSRAATPQPWMSPSHPETPDAPAFDMSITVGENTAREMGLTRRDVDEWAAYSARPARSRRSTTAAFEEEIVPVEVTRPDGDTRTFSRRRAPAPRRRRSRRSATLKPLHPEIEGFTVTAGNAAGLNDAAAAVVVASERLRRRPRPAARWPGSLSWASVGRRARPAPAWARRSPSRRRSTAPA